MAVTELRDKATIERFLRRQAALHLYELGDLDVFWPDTRWFTTLDEQGEPLSILMLYTADALPVLLALEETAKDAAQRLLAELVPQLPVPVYGHFSLPLLPALERYFTCESPASLLRLTWTNPAAAAALPQDTTLRRLTAADLGSLLAFYAEAYGGHWFHPRMLESGLYFGAFAGSELISAAGTHVLAPKTRVAALGNIATLPAHRGRGLAQAVTAELCRALKLQVDLIGLNVREDNAAARRCYERIGFTTAARFAEVMIKSRR